MIVSMKKALTKKYRTTASKQLWSLGPILTVWALSMAMPTQSQETEGSVSVEDKAIEGSVNIKDKPVENSAYVEDRPVDELLFEDPPEEDRYRVEVIVFEQEDSYGAEGKSLVKTVTFPGRLRLLQMPASLHSKLPENATKAEQLANLMVPSKFFTYESAKREDNYAVLDKSERSLNPDAYTLNRSSAYRVLFHQAWKQRLDGKNSTPWVYISGGTEFGDHRELEGSLRIYQSRFTHVEVKLWLADFEAQLPKVPDITSPAPGANPNQFAINQQEQIQLPEPPKQPEPEYLKLIENLLPQTTEMDQGIGIDGESFQSYSSGSTANDEFSADTIVQSTGYKIASIDLLQSSEQIRRKSLHYIDHPRLGVLVLVTPIEAEDAIE